MNQKKTSRLFALLLAALMGLSMTSCGSTEHYNYNWAEYLETADISSISISRKELEEELADAKESLQNSKATTEDLKEGDVLQDGDDTVIDYVGRMNGETFSGGSGTDYSLKLGSDKFIDGFEDGLIGVKVGEETVLNLKFPDDYRDEKNDPDGAATFNGKDVEFTVTVKSAKRNILPTFDDAFVKENSSYETVAEFEADKRNTIMGNLALSAYVSACRVKTWPEKEYKEAFESYYSMYKTYATYSGMSVKEYVESTGSSLDAMYDSINSSASNAVKQEMVYHYLVEYLKLNPSEEEYDEGLDKLAKDSGYESISELLDLGYSEDSLRESVLFQMVNDYLAKNVKINEDQTSEDASSASGDASEDENSADTDADASGDAAKGDAASGDSETND